MQETLTAWQLNKRGFAKNQLGQYQAAIADFDEAIRLDPNNANAFNNRGDAKDALGQYQEAITDYDEAIRLKPDDKQAFNKRGIIKTKLTLYDTAIADYDAAIQFSPNYIQAFNNRGIAKAELRQYDDGIADFNKAICLEPNYAIAFYNRGIAKTKLEQYEAAINDYDKAIRLKADGAQTFNKRGLAKAELRQYAAAIADYDVAIQLKPDYVIAFYNRGVAKAELRQYAAAIADYDIAIHFNPQYIKATNNCRITKDRLNKYNAALSHYQQVIRPQNTPVFNKQGFDKIDLTDQKLGETQIEVLLNNLNEENLVSLNLNNHLLTESHINLLKKLFIDNKVLKYLYLKNTGLKSNDAELIALLLESNFTLKTLILEKNQLGNAGVKTIIDTLHKSRNCTLTWLDVSNNQLTNQTANSIKNLFEVNYSLATVKLDFNNLDSSSLACIKNSTKRNLQLKEQSFAQIRQAAKLLATMYKSKNNLFYKYQVPKELAKVIASQATTIIEPVCHAKEALTVATSSF